MTADQNRSTPTCIALAIAALALAKFALETKPALSAGMTGFDTTWYHAPFAAGFFQGGDTWSLHFIAPQFLAWFYPANAELFHSLGMIAFERDVLSPLLNLGWLAACLLASWCIGRPYGVAPWSLALAALALSVPAFADQAGEARNDVVGTFFLLASVAIALNGPRPSAAPPGGRSSVRIPDESATADGFGGGERRIAALPLGVVAVGALAAGLAAGTKLNFFLPAAVLVFGLGWLAGSGKRARGLGVAAGAALLGGGYWYLRNLAHSGNPLPWIDSIGPISVPAPDQPLGGREGHSVLGYLTDGAVWSDWLLPGLRDGLTILWPLALGLAVGGIALALADGFRRPRGGRSETAAESGRSNGPAAGPPLVLAGATALATMVAWLIAPTSASGPDGIPRGFESGLRYLVPALALSLALLPATHPLRRLLASPGTRVRSHFRPLSEQNYDHPTGPPPGTRVRSHFRPPSERKYDRRGWLGVVGGAVVLVVVVAGYPVQRHYLENRYADPAFAAPGLNSTFAWSSDLTDASVATTSTRQYPLYGPDLSNRVQFVGVQRPHGGFVVPAECPTWRRLLNEGAYDYAVTSRDRLEPAKPPYPETTRWTESPGATVVLREPPTTVFRLSQPLPPSGCPR